MRIEFTIPGQPVGKGRPKFARKGGFVRAYTPEKTASYENLVAMAAHDAMKGKSLILGAADVTVRMYVSVPSSWSKKKIIAALAGEIRPITKPDMDNVVKGIFDAMNGIVWKDDSQVTDCSVIKRYAETPRAEVTVEAA